MEMFNSTLKSEDVKFFYRVLYQYEKEGTGRHTGYSYKNVPLEIRKKVSWESGIRLGISFSKKKNKIVETPSVPQTEVLHQDTILSENVNQKEKETVDKAETKVVEQDIKEPVKVTFPVIYFSFNRITIRPSEVSKLKSILHILKENPEMKVTVTGWCDTRGSVAVNRRISRQRAQALKTWLVKRGIAASRISVVGKGSDASRTAPKARRVETTNHHQ